MYKSPTPDTRPAPAIRRQALVDMLGLSESTIQRMIDRGEFPPARQLGPRAIAWLRTEVEAWLAARPVSNQPPVASRGKS